MASPELPKLPILLRQAITPWPEEPAEEQEEADVIFVQVYQTCDAFLREHGSYYEEDQVLSLSMDIPVEGNQRVPVRLTKLFPQGTITLRIGETASRFGFLELDGHTATLYRDEYPGRTDEVTRLRRGNMQDAQRFGELTDFLKQQDIATLKT